MLNAGPANFSKKSLDIFHFLRYSISTMNPPTKTETFLSVNLISTYFIEVDELTKYNGVTTVRTCKEIATELLLNNMSIIRGGNIRYFQIKHIGLGVYAVKLRDNNRVNTILVEDWEKRIINNTERF